jgi:carbamate kinase
MIPEERVDELVGRGWTLVIDPHRRAWRRVVASPDPKEIVEAAAIKALIDDGVVLIAAGGGGIPVVQSPDGDLRGVPAVVDKDFASALLAADLDASELMIVTDVENAYLDYDTPKQRPIDALSPSVAREYLAEGVFGAGSMAPKIEALCRFVEATGRSGVVTSIDRCLHALHGSAGTRVAFD